MTTRILPLLRGLMRRDGVLPRLTCESPPEFDSSLPDAELLEKLREMVGRGVLSAPPLGSQNVVGTEGGAEGTPRPTYDHRPGRVSGKVAFVTGAAQGFGLEIATALHNEGAYVVLADMNFEGVSKAAAKLADKNVCSTLAVAINVTQPESVAKAVETAVAAFGGIDIFVSNAGVLKAESVMTQPLKDFQFVTDVNYTGFFICAQAVAPVMARQNLAAPGAWCDIIQINSKSGLQGSNKNAAYAGSKFGGIGLVQSFAYELVAHNIKVNAICPGNFFDGPLWSHPETGLFTQYLRAGKVPGAKTLADVRKFYEDKVPMRRGCEAPDVMRAIYYLVEQLYETGQALPVTGGQVMLN